MKSTSGRSQNIRYNNTKLYCLIAALCVILLLIIVLTAVQIANNSGEKTPDSPTESSSVPPLTSSGSESVLAPTTSLPDTEDPASQTVQGKVMVECTADDLTRVNPLIIVNAEHPFDPGKAPSVVPIKGEDVVTGGASLNCYTYSNMLNTEAITALQLLQGDLKSMFEDKATLFVYISYTSALIDYADPTTSSYNIGLTNARCAAKDCTDVSHSDHATGYAVDIRYLNPIEPLSAPGRAEHTNALISLGARRGLITTKENGQISWHVRYVGLPHALYITENKLTLEEYHAALKETNYMKRLKITDGDTQYEMYYIPASAAGATTNVPVPAEGYTYQICGNGVDGFIVTLTSPVTA